jgi:hypothetical protein
MKMAGSKRRDIAERAAMDETFDYPRRGKNWMSLINQSTSAW